jgi:hypothetical protein
VDRRLYIRCRGASCPRSRKKSTTSCGHFPSIQLSTSLPPRHRLLPRRDYPIPPTMALSTCTIDVSPTCPSTTCQSPTLLNALFCRCSAPMAIEPVRVTDLIGLSYLAGPGRPPHGRRITWLGGAPSGHIRNTPRPFHSTLRPRVYSTAKDVQLRLVSSEQRRWSF